MRRRLIVLRHAKSDWGSGAESDHERPLNERGRRAAPLIAERLLALGWVPEVVISSDATRTRQTWARMREVFGEGPLLRVSRALYLAGPTEARATICGLEADVGTAMIIGHNPGWEDVVAEMSEVRVRMTTCNAALLAIESESWTDAAGRSDWQFDSVLRPKEL